MIYVNGEKAIKVRKNFWNNLHFHPTDAIEDDWGQRILNDIAADGVAKTIRMYSMMEDIVKADGNGKLIYDFTENDVRMDYMVSKGFRLLICYAFMPPCMAKNPEETSNVSKNATRYKGKMIVTSAAKDYSQWEEVCYEYTKHIVERYGLDTVKSWYLECYNEPDISPFFMRSLGDEPGTEIIRAGEYCKLYYGFSKAIERVNPALRCGGPGLAGRPAFLEIVLKYITENKLKFDFYTGHTYGTDAFALARGDGHFCVSNTIPKHKWQLEMVEKYCGKDLEFIIDEWGASAHGFFNREKSPKLMLREGSDFAAYFGKMITRYIDEDLKVSKLFICLSGQHEMVVDFSGFRNFYTKNFITKPIRNAFWLGTKLYENILEKKTDNENIDVLGTKNGEGNMAILVSYADEYFEKPLPRLADKVTVDGVSGKRHVRVWLIDNEHGDPYHMALRNGWGDDYDEEKLAALRAEGRMKVFSEYDAEFSGKAEIEINCTENALWLCEITK